MRLACLEMKPLIMRETELNSPSSRSRTSFSRSRFFRKKKIYHFNVCNKIVENLHMFGKIPHFPYVSPIVCANSFASYWQAVSRVCVKRKLVRKAYFWNRDFQKENTALRFYHNISGTANSSGLVAMPWWAISYESTRIDFRSESGKKEKMCKLERIERGKKMEIEFKVKLK